MTISNDTRFWLVSRRFTIEYWRDSPDMGILKDSAGEVLYQAVGHAGVGEKGEAKHITAQDDIKQKLYGIIKDGGIANLLNRYPVEITFKTYAHKADIMPNITKLLITKLKD